MKYKFLQGVNTVQKRNSKTKIRSNTDVIDKKWTRNYLDQFKRY